jgi:hypothetical protein
MRTILIDLLVACAILLAGAGLMYHHEHPKIVAAQAERDAAVRAAASLVAQRAIDDATTASLARKKAEIGRSSASAGHRLAAAVASSPDWADQAVPAAVQEALK